MVDPIVRFLEEGEGSGVDILLKYNDFKPLPGKPLLLALIGPSSAGKDSTLKPLVESGLLSFIKTATSRKRRVSEHEPMDAYVWMNEVQGENESRVDYINCLVKKYDLVEYDDHHGNIYGIPRKSFYDARKLGIPVFRGEINGVKTILQKFNSEFNILVVAIMPENLDQIKRRLQGRDHVDIRIKDSLETLPEYLQYVNYVIKNIQGENGLLMTQQTLKNLINDIRK